MSGLIDLREAIAGIIDPLPFDESSTGWIGMPETKAIRQGSARARADAILALLSTPSNHKGGGE